MKDYWSDYFIRIEADCVVPTGVFVIAGDGGELIVEKGVELLISHED